MHKYIMGLYKILERLTAEFPDVLFESAGPSVGRFNLGMLAYMPLMSAGGGEGVDSNLMARRAASYGYPVSCLSSHICEDRERLEGASALEHGFNAAAFGALGYQLNLNAIKKPNIKAITKQIEFYKKNRALLQYGALLRADTALGDAIRWQVVSEGMSEAIMGVYPNDAMRLSDAPRIKFLGLDPEKVYTLSSRRQVISIKDNDGILPFIKRGLLISGQAFAKNRTYIEQQSFLAGGDALMYVGFKPRETVLGEQAAGLAVNGSRVYHVGVTG
jgi:alpha-galactosidase